MDQLVAFAFCDRLLLGELAYSLLRFFPDGLASGQQLRERSRCGSIVHHLPRFQSRGHFAKILGRCLHSKVLRSTSS